MVQCQACHAETVFEHDPASGTAYCTICGSVAEENGIVAEVTFGENSTGAAVVNGAYVGADQTRVKASGGRRPAGAGGVESREQTIANGRRKIQAMINALRLPDRFTDPAQRFYTLALTNNFVRGRRTNYVVSACLYIVCRMEKTSHMLIDFSDLLQVNVFILGSTYLKLVRDLNLTIPAIDPSLYISRFASLLEFGDETQQVANDAVRLVQRFSRDWMHTGRRPAGICGAALVLAARMNNFRRSIEEVVQVVKIADGTLKKRLEEFSQTPSSALTITDFRTVDLNETVDPPAFIDNKKKETHLRTAKRGKKVRFSKTGVVSDDDEEEEGDDDEQAEQDLAEEEADGAPVSSAPNGAAQVKGPKGGMQAINAQMDAMAAAGGNGLAAEEDDDDDDGGDDLNVPLFDERDEEGNIRSALASITAAEQEEQDTLRHARSRSRSATPAGEAAAELGWRQGSRPPAPDMRTAEEIARDEAESAEIAQSISTELSTRHYSAISGELTEKERNRWVNAQNPGALRFTNPPEVTSMDVNLAPADGAGEGGEGDATVMPVVEAIDTLSDLDEDELDALILTEDEVKIKERLWMEFNKDYLANVAEKHLRAELDEKPIKKRDRKKRQQPRDSSMPSGETAAEATKQLLKQKKFSKKINYAAIDSLLAGDTVDAYEDMKNNVGGADGEATVNFFNGDDENDDAVSTTSRAVSVAASERSNASSSASGVKKRKRRSSSRANASLEEAERLKRKLEVSSLSSSSSSANKKRKNIFPTQSSSSSSGGLINKDGKVLRPNLKRASMSNVSNGRHTSTAGSANGAGDPAKAQSSPTRSDATLSFSEDVGEGEAQAGADGEMEMEMDLAPAVDEEDEEEDDEREASAPPAAPDEDEDEMTAEFRRLQRGRSGENDEDEDVGDDGDDAW